MYQKLYRLPLGSVTPKGWLLEQLRRNADGIGGHLDELEPRMIATPFTTRETLTSWGAAAAGWGAEISGNFWTGLIELAFTLKDARLMKKADDWVAAVLKNQRGDGYLGTYTEKDNPYEDYNAWGTACGMNALLAYYDATGREDVFEAVFRCMLWFCENWAGERKTRYIGIHITETMYRCYLIRPDERFVKFWREYNEFLEKNDLFSNSPQALHSKKLHYNSNHGAGYCNHMDNPALFYACTGEEYYLEASKNAWRKARAKVVLPTGGITCESEYLAPLGSAVETEYCAFTMSQKSLGHLALITGDASYADDIEKIIFNGAQGARKKDERAMAYLSSPNQIYAGVDTSYAAKTHQAYAPTVPVSCCSVNSVRIMPEFASNILLRSEDRLWLTVYAPAEIRADGLSLTLDTQYPFEDTIRVRMDGEKSSRLSFRVPEWCDAPEAMLNGVPAEILKSETGYAVLAGDPQLCGGDALTLRFPMKVRVAQLNDIDRLNAQPLYIMHGPLLYSLPIPEKWEAWRGEPATPLPEGWSWFEVKPDIPKSKLPIYEHNGDMRDRISWNVALDERLSADEITVKRIPSVGYAWENSPVRLTVSGYKAPYSYPPYPQRTMEPYTDGGYAAITEKRELTLVPYGCTALRITCFVRARHEDTL